MANCKKCGFISMCPECKEKLNKNLSILKNEIYKNAAPMVDRLTKILMRFTK